MSDTRFKEHTIGRIDDLIKKGKLVLARRDPASVAEISAVIASGIGHNRAAFTEWRSQAASLLNGLLGSSDEYSIAFSNEVVLDTADDISGGIGILRAVREEVEAGRLRVSDNPDEPANTQTASTRAEFGMDQSRISLEAEALLMRLYDAWERLPAEQRQHFFITHAGAGFRVVTLAHPALPAEGWSVPGAYIEPLRKRGYLDYELRHFGGSPYPGILWITTAGRDYALERRRSDPKRDRATKPRLIIVHGHDNQTKLEVKNFLQNRLGLPEPIILHEVPNRGRTIIEKFEDTASEADGAIVLLTPDDLYVTDGSDDDLRRARQNVILELGYFLAHFGRLSGKVLLLHKGPIELPSDLGGVVYIDISNGVESKGEEIRRELGIP